jgi:hypothetical protein
VALGVTPLALQSPAKRPICSSGWNERFTNVFLARILRCPPDLASGGGEVAADAWNECANRTVLSRLVVGGVCSKKPSGAVETVIYRQTRILVLA